MSSDHDETNGLDLSDRFWGGFSDTKNESKLCSKSEGSLSSDNSHEAVGGDGIFSDSL